MSSSAIYLRSYASVTVLPRPVLVPEEAVVMVVSDPVPSRNGFYVKKNGLWVQVTVASSGSGGGSGGPADPHASTHAAGGSDALTLSTSQITNLDIILAGKASTSALALKANATDLAAKADVTALAAKADVTALALKANATDLALKANASDLAAKADVTALAGKVDVSSKGVASGVATLDSSGKVPTTQLPALAVNNTFVVGSQAAMTSLTAEKGDVAVRTDLSKSFILAATPASTLANWQELLAPAGGVTSFNGRSGTVSPNANDYAVADINGLATALAAKADVTALAGKVDVSSKGAANGVASLGATGTVPVAQLPVGTTAGTVAAGDDSRFTALSNALASGVTSVFSRTGAVTKQAGDYTADDITGLGTAAKKDVAVTGNASATQVVLGNDGRLSDSRAPTGSISAGDLAGSYPSPTVGKILGKSLPAVATTTLTKGQLLHYDGTGWVTGGAYPTATDKIPLDGQVLTWNNAGGRWEAKDSAVAAGSITLSGDVTGAANNTSVTKLRGKTVSSTAPTATGQVLSWNNTTSQWEPATATVAASSVTLTGDVTGTAAATVIATGAVTNLKIAAGTIAADRLAAGVIPTALPPNGSAAGTGSDLAGTYPSPTVAKLQGKTLTIGATPATNDVLSWNGTAFVNAPAQVSAGSVTLAGDVTGAANSTVVGKVGGKTFTLGATPASGDVLQYNGTAFVNQPLQIGTKSVASTTPSNGQVLTYNGTNWAPVSPSSVPNGSAGGQHLVWDGSAWAAVAMSGDATQASGGAVTLANSGVAANTYGSASLIPQITVDAKGRITSVTTVAPSVAAGIPSYLDAVESDAVIAIDPRFADFTLPTTATRIYTGTDWVNNYTTYTPRVGSLIAPASLTQADSTTGTGNAPYVGAGKPTSRGITFFYNGARSTLIAAKGGAANLIAGGFAFYCWFRNETANSTTGQRRLVFGTSQYYAPGNETNGAGYIYDSMYPGFGITCGPNGATGQVGNIVSASPGQFTVYLESAYAAGIAAGVNSDHAPYAIAQLYDTDRDWHLVGATYNGTSFEIFFDGVRVGTAVTRANFAGSGVSSPIVFGCTPRANSSVGGRFGQLNYTLGQFRWLNKAGNADATYYTTTYGPTFFANLYRKGLGYAD